MVNTQYILTDALSQFKAFLKIFYQETIAGSPKPANKQLSNAFLDYKYIQLEQLVDWMGTYLLGGQAASDAAEASSDLPPHQQIPQTLQQLKKTVRQLVQHWDQQEHVRASSVDERFKRRLSKLEYTAHLFIHNYNHPSNNPTLEQQLSQLLLRFSGILQGILANMEEPGAAAS